jgi:RHS repeat-associated protein
LSSIDGPLLNDLVQYQYDELGRAFKRTMGNVSQASSHTLLSVFDSLGRTTSITNALGGFQYSYLNQTARLSQVLNPNGQKTLFTYFDNLGDQRLKEIKHISPTSSLISSFLYEYNSEGQITRWTRQFDVQPPTNYTFKYDAIDQLVGAQLSSSTAQLASFNYGYDKAGNRISEQVNVLAPSPANPFLQKSDHNNLNQLTAQSGGGNLHLEGDLDEPAKSLTINQTPVGITSTESSVPGGPRRDTFAAEIPVQVGTNTLSIVAKDFGDNVSTNKFQVVVAGGLTKTLTYDLNGNMIKEEWQEASGKKQLDYTYDANDRCTSISVGQASLPVSARKRVEFTYDGLGRRVRILEKDGAALLSDKRYLWCGLELCEERQIYPLTGQIPTDGSIATKRYFAQGFQALTFSNSTYVVSNYFYTRDHLGSVRELVDQTGTIRGRWDYDPWGNQTANLITSNPVNADFSFTGHYYYKPAWLPKAHILAPYRIYRPDLGRWTTRDPIAERGGLHLYAYVGNDPVNKWDEDGLFVAPGASGAAVKAAQAAGGASGGSSAVAVGGSALALGGLAIATYDFGSEVAGYFEDSSQAEAAKEQADVAQQEYEKKKRDKGKNGCPPDEDVVVRGGQSPLPPPGTVFSGSSGANLVDAASGVPHGTIRSTTAGAIRAAGGTVTSAPELTRSKPPGSIPD